MKYIKKTGLFICLIFLLVFSGVVTVFASEHIHTFTVLYTAKATCTEKGFTVYSCECGESYSADISEALGHDYSENAVCFKEATCIAEGETGRYCKRCYAKTDVVYSGKTAHTPVNVTVKAGFNKDGEKRRECSVCKKLYSSEKIRGITTVSLEKKTYTYDGKTKTPSVTVRNSERKTLAEGTDYSVSYQKGRKNTGRYSVRIKLRGSYEGEKTLCFNIRPSAVKGIEVVPSFSSVGLSWNKSKGADGYEIYLKTDKLQLIRETKNLYTSINKINGKKLKSGRDYTFVIKSYKNSGDERIYSAVKKINFSTKPQKARIKKLLGSGNVKVTAVKQSCHGYEFLLSTNKSFSNAKSFKTKGKSKNTYTFRNLVKGKTYYVKVRAYVVSGGLRYNGYYSNVRTFKG